MDDSKIFREEFAIQYPTLGRPLWEPDPGGLYDAVQVGDVGFIRHGYFYCLFNALVDHPPNFDESDGSDPCYPQRLQPKTPNHIRTSRYHGKDFRSKNVTELSREPNVNAFGPDDDTQVTYSCSGRQGALLYLPFPAEREDTVALGDFGKWMVKNIDVCMRLAEERGLGVSRMEDIILVTGRHLARSWARAVFSESRGGAQASFCVRVSGDSIVHLEERNVSGAQLAFGPNGEVALPENQCIFVRGYHVVRVLNIWPRLRAMAGPAPGLDEPEPESDARLQLMGVPADDNYQDPLHTLMEYITESVSTCDMVLVHDDDLSCIEGAIPPQETLQPDALMEYFRANAPTISQFQCEYYDSNESNSDAEVTTATVATLSRMFEASRDEDAEDRPSPMSIQVVSESGHSLSTGSIDRTPCSLISNTHGPDDEGCEDESRRSSAKMGAIDDAGRRPSLPINIYTLDRHGADNLSNSSTRSSEEASGSESDPTASGNASGAYLDRRRGSGSTVDRDVELQVIVPDDASQNTLVSSPYAFDVVAKSDDDGCPATQQFEDWYIADSAEGRQDASSSFVFLSAERGEDDSDVSETGTRVLATTHHDKFAVRVTIKQERSFHPSETDYRQMQTNTQEHEDSASTVRRGNNEETEELEASIQSLATGPNRERRQSLPTPNWSMFTNTEGISTTDDLGEGVYQDIDLNYIMNVGGSASLGSRRSSISFVAPRSLPSRPPKGKSKSKKDDKRKKDKTKGKETLDTAAAQGPIDLPAVMPNRLEIAPWAGADETTGPFDPGYTERYSEWSFIREREQVVLLPRDPEGSPRMWDVWCCAQIGKIRLERAILTSSDPDKPSQQRLNAEHEFDLDSTNNLGGPTTVIHRHSRALAFSIYRHYSLKSHRPERSRTSLTTSTRTQRSSEGRSTVMPAHDSILLATKRVQMQFTHTKCTSRLHTHGLLPEDSDNRSDNGPYPTHSQLSSQGLPEKSPSQEAHSPRQTMEFTKLGELDNETTSLRWSQSIRTITPPPTYLASSLSDQQLIPLDEAEEDSDREFANLIPHTSHAEAFATLDSFAIDQITEQVPAPATRRSHGNWIQRIIGPRSSSTLHTLSSNLAPTNPPWMTLIPHSTQEEQDHATQGLRSSFKDVGLVSSTRPKGGVGSGLTGKGENKDMLTQVPDGSLFMLLPLWPHETDPASAAREQKQRPVRGLDIERNLYLLVYYVPFDKRGEVKTAKKRSRSRKGDHEQHYPTPLFDARCGFKVVGRLIARSDLIGSGLRLPVRGLTVTGSLAEAEQGMPSASLREEYSDDFVIGVCLDRSGNIEFVPEGLEKLGLCVPRSGPLLQLQTHPAVWTVEPSKEEDVPQQLTAIGRAAVEVVWLGCMALTTFYAI